METILATWFKPGELAVNVAGDRRRAGGSLLDAVEAGLAAAEDAVELIAIGRGSLPNADGELELDASIMEGTHLNAGAVCAVRGILPIISVARRVMERTPHVMLAGDQARRFAIEQGFHPQNLVTPEVCRRYEEYLVSPERAKAYVHTIDDEVPHDTVTMLACDAEGKCVAASSTSGMPYKLPGRVGDSPIVGAGIYADDEAGCAGATGLGEELWKACASFRVVEYMRQGRSAQEACEAVVGAMQRRQPACRETICVVLALRPDGDFGAAVTTGEFDLWVHRNGETARHHFETYQG